MARRRVGKYIELSGPLFDDNVGDRIKDALAGGILDLAKEGADIAQDFVTGGGFVQSGRFVRSIGVEVVRSRGAGYASVKVLDESAAWPTPGRPTRTWMEYGLRGASNRASGTFRPGIYAFRKTARNLNKRKYDEFFLPALMGVLE